jgi:hypothetical protein
MAIKPQDVVVCLALATVDPPTTFAGIGQRVGLSASEAHAAVQRLRRAGLVDAERRVNRGSLLEFLVHGLRHAFPVSIGGPSLGVPTGAAAPVVKGLPRPEMAPWVWPSAQGSVRGLALAPLYPTVPEAVSQPSELYELLALADVMRAGRPREVSLARRRLRAMLASPGQAESDAAVDVSSTAALSAIFNRQRIAFSVAKRYREGRNDLLVRHPLAGAVLAAYRDEIAETLAATVPAGDWTPGPAYHVVIKKGDGGERDLVFPNLIDSVVGRRVMDELEPRIRRGDGDRVFAGRNHTSSLRAAGVYDRWFGEWSRYLASMATAAKKAGFAAVLNTDIRDFFPSIDHPTARQTLAQRTDAHPSVIALLFACLEAWLPRFDYRRGGGLPIEPHGVSGLVAHCLLKSVDDRFEDGPERAYRRFVDDTVVFVPTRTDAEGARVEHRQALATIGVRPNERKTRIETTAEFLAARHEDVFRAIEAAEESGSAADFMDLARGWYASREQMKRDGQSDAWIRVARRLYAAAERLGVDSLQEQAVDDATDAETGARAARYLEGCVLSGSSVESLQALYIKSDEVLTPGTRIAIARTLATAPLSDDFVASSLADWAAHHAILGPSSRGDGYARGLLLLLVYKHGERDVRLRVLDQATSAHLSDRYFRLFFFYVFWATEELPEALESFLRQSWDDDFSLLVRICSDARARRLRRLRAVLRQCRSRKSRQQAWQVSPERLPFLRIVSEASAAKVGEPDRKQIESWRKTVLDWIEDTLRGESTPRDAAVRRLLESHRERLRR